ncbi:hypothetical protein [Shimazuella soli]|nr:hypothetical protein [Shimazuella soli]
MLNTQRRKLDFVARISSLFGSALFFISSIILFLLFFTERRSFV